MVVTSGWSLGTEGGSEWSLGTEGRGCGGAWELREEGVGGACELREEGVGDPGS